jgi:hypothetical protein
MMLTKAVLLLKTRLLKPKSWRLTLTKKMLILEPVLIKLDDESEIDKTDGGDEAGDGADDAGAAEIGLLVLPVTALMKQGMLVRR